MQLNNTQLDQWITGGGEPPRDPSITRHTRAVAALGLAFNVEVGSDGEVEAIDWSTLDVEERLADAMDAWLQDAWDAALSNGCFTGLTSCFGARAEEELAIIVDARAQVRLCPDCHGGTQVRARLARYIQQYRAEDLAEAAGLALAMERL